MNNAGISYSRRPHAPVIMAPSMDQVKKDIEQDELFQKPVSLAEIELVPSADESRNIQIGQNTYGLESRAFNDLMSIIGVKSDAGKKMTKDSVNKMVLDAMKALRQSDSKKSNVTVLADRHRNIVRVFRKGAAPKIGSRTFLSLLDRYMNTEDFRVVDFQRGNNRSMGVFLMAPGQFDVGGLKDESFWPGVCFGFDPLTGTVRVDMAPVRSLCDNNMIFRPDMGMMPGLDPFLLKDPADLSTWVTNLAVLRDNGYQTDYFKQRVLKARETPASYAEAMFVDDAVRSSVQTPEDGELDLSSFTNLTVLHEAYTKVGIDPEKIDQQGAKALMADRTVWDLVNQMTDLGSHDYLPLAYGGRSKLRNSAMKLMTKAYDHEGRCTKQAFKW